MLRYFHSARGIILTLLVVAIALAMVRLGFWQLDRLKQRRAANSAMIAQMNAPQLDLGTVQAPQSLVDFAYRSVQVSGVYDISQQVYLKNQVWGNQLGVHLITPLIISGSRQAVLVDRGWIPFGDAVTGRVDKYSQTGQVTINGVIRLQQIEPTFGGISDPPQSAGQTSLKSWFFINIDRIQQQINYPLLPVYVLMSPRPDKSQLPYLLTSVPDLTDGPHLSYAIQWFSFTAILLIGYPIILQRRLRNREQ